MASLGFQFKSFFVRHDNCAMKVGTDSIILGSWLDVDNARLCLDIGTGSGLLALMLAQKVALLTQAKAEIEAEIAIVAIEPDDSAVQQAQYNVSQSPWHRSIKTLHCDLQGFIENVQPAPSLSYLNTFDLIVSNPPYYAAHQPNSRDSNLLAMSESRKLARQTANLSLLFLMQSVNKLLSESGRFYCVLPVESEAEFRAALASTALFAVQRLDIRTTEKKGVRRQCWCIQKTPLLLGASADSLKYTQGQTKEEVQTLVIHEANGGYSSAFKALCQDFYLSF